MVTTSVGEKRLRENAVLVLNRGLFKDIIENPTATTATGARSTSKRTGTTRLLFEKKKESDRGTFTKTIPTTSRSRLLSVDLDKSIPATSRGTILATVRGAWTG